jgi:hypothetical protein
LWLEERKYEPDEDFHKVPHHVALPSSAYDDVKSLVALDDEKLRLLTDILGNPASISMPSEQVVESVADKLQLDIATVESVVLVCQFLLTVVEEGTPAQAVVDDVRAFIARQAKGEDRDLLAALEKRRKLLETLVPSAERLRAQKVKYLEHGLYGTVDSFRTVCELRPVFERPNNKEAIVGFVSTIFLEIKSSDQDGDERQVLLQLTPEKLEALKEVVARTEEKLAVIRARFGKELLGG